MKKISIMITSYNLVDYIDESIASVVNQEFPCDWELLIGDDGSTDGTIERLKIWKEKYPDNISYVVRDRPDTNVKDGYRAAKNRAALLESATGDYLIYLDGDDCWLETEKLKTQFEVLENPANTDCSCCAHNIQAYIVSENKKYSWISEEMPSQKLDFKKYYANYYFHTNTILFRKECKVLLLNSLYRDHLNDNFITFLLLQGGKVYYLNRVWARYNITGQGLWTGHKRMYGALRNVTLYDLERFVNPSVKRITIMKYRANLIKLLNEFRNEDYDDIIPIIQPLDHSVFKMTLLLSQRRPFSFIIKAKRFLLRIEIYGYRVIDKTYKLFYV